MPLLEITPNTPSRGDKSRVQKRFVTLFTGRLRRNGAVAQIHWARQDSRQVPHPSDVVLTVPLVVIWLPIVPDEVLVRRAKAHDVLRRRWAAVELLGGDGHKAVLLKERRKNAMVRPGKGGLRSGQIKLTSSREMNAGTSDAFMSKRDTTMASSSHPSSTLNEAISIVSRIAIPLSRKMGATCLKTRRYPRTVASSAGRSSVSLGLMLSSPLSLSLTYPKPEVLDRVESRKCGPLRQERTIANHSNDGFSLLALRAP